MAAHPLEFGAMSNLSWDVTFPDGKHKVRSGCAIIVRASRPLVHFSSTLLANAACMGGPCRFGNMRTCACMTVHYIYLTIDFGWSLCSNTAITRAHRVPSLQPVVSDNFFENQSNSINHSSHAMHVVPQVVVLVPVVLQKYHSNHTRTLPMRPCFRADLQPIYSYSSFLAQVPTTTTTHAWATVPWPLHVPFIALS